MLFLLSTDDNYVFPTGVLICSICENNPGGHLFYILTGKSLSTENVYRLKTTVGRYSSRISFLTVPTEYEQLLPIGRDGQPRYITIATYYRLFLQSLLPETVDKILYLDGDIICRGSLRELWDTDICDSPVAGVFEIENGDGRYDRLGYPEKDGYYNAGMLLINVKWWRDNDVQNLFLDYIENNSKSIIYHDQDVINAVLHGRFLTLPLKYNVLNSYFIKDKLKYRYDNGEINDARRNPILVHYSSHLKPWYKGCSHPYTRDFLVYKNISQWRKTSLKTFPAFNMRGVVANILVWLGVKFYNGNYINLGE